MLDQMFNVNQQIHRPLVAYNNQKFKPKLYLFLKRSKVCSVHNLKNIITEFHLGIQFQIRIESIFSSSIGLKMTLKADRLVTF